MKKTATLMLIAMGAAAIGGCATYTSYPYAYPYYGAPGAVRYIERSQQESDGSASSGPGTMEQDINQGTAPVVTWGYGAPPVSWYGDWGWAPSTAYLGWSTWYPVTTWGFNWGAAYYRPYYWAGYRPYPAPYPRPGYPYPRPGYAPFPGGVPPGWRPPGTLPGAPLYRGPGVPPPGFYRGPVVGASPPGAGVPRASMFGAQAAPVAPRTGAGRGMFGRVR